MSSRSREIGSSPANSRRNMGGRLAKPNNAVGGRAVRVPALVIGVAMPAGGTAAAVPEPCPQLRLFPQITAQRPVLSEQLSVRPW
jgi:hypothetical protein